jgi:hypothetical protein
VSSRYEWVSRETPRRDREAFDGGRCTVGGPLLGVLDGGDVVAAEGEEWDVGEPVVVVAVGLGHARADVVALSVGLPA